MISDLLDADFDDLEESFAAHFADDFITNETGRRVRPAPLSDDLIGTSRRHTSTYKG